MTVFRTLDYKRGGCGYPATKLLIMCNCVVPVGIGAKMQDCNQQQIEVRVPPAVHVYMVSFYTDP